MAKKLSASLIDSALSEIEGWSLSTEREAIFREFRFASFNAAFAFMTRVALRAEKKNHHPDWSNSFNRVEVFLSTHEAGGVTERDLEMARFMNRIYSES